MSEMVHPFLVGRNVYLRRVEKSDLDPNGRYFQWLNDSEVTQYMFQGTFPNSLENMIAYYEQSIGSQNQVNFAIIAKEGNVHVGNIGLNSIEWVHRTAELGLLVGDKSYWGKGVALDAVELLAGYAFDKLNLRKLWGGTQDRNVPVVVLFKKMGWTQEGRQREHVIRDDSPRDILLFGLLREEYYARVRARGRRIAS